MFRLVKKQFCKYVELKRTFQFSSNSFSADKNRSSKTNQHYQAYNNILIGIQDPKEQLFETFTLGGIQQIKTISIEGEQQIENLSDQDVELNQRFFAGTLSIDTFLSNYISLKNQITPQNAFILVKGLSKVINVKGQDNEQMILFLNQDQRFKEFIQQITSYIPELTLTALIDILRFIRTIWTLGRKNLNIIDGLVKISKRQIDQIIEEQVLQVHNSENQDKQQQLLHPNQAAILFYIYNTMNWNSYQIYQLVDRQIREYSNYNKTQKDQQIVYNSHSLRMIIKGCFYARLENQESSKFGELAYKVQIALLGSLNFQLDLDQTITLYSELAFLELNQRTTHKQNPQLLLKLNQILNDMLEKDHNLFSLPQVIKLIQAQKFIPVTYSSNLYKLSKFYLERQNIELIVQLSTNVKLLNAFNGQRKELHLSSGELDNLFSRIFIGLQNNQRMPEYLKIDLLKSLIALPHSWDNTQNKLILSNYFKDSNKNQFEIGILLVELQIHQTGFNLMQSASNNNIFNGDMKVWQLFRINNHLKSFTQSEIHIDKDLKQIVRDSLNNLDSKQVFLLLKKIASDQCFKNKEGFATSWAEDKILQHWSSFDTAQRTDIIVYFINSNSIGKKQMKFFENQLELLGDEQFLSITKKISRIKIQNPIIVNFYFQLFEIVIRGQLMQDSLKDDKVNQYLQAFISTISNISVHQFKNRRGTTINALRETLQLLKDATNQVDSSAVIIKNISSDQIAQTSRLLSLLDEKPEFIQNLFYLFVRHNITEELILSKKDRFMLLQFTESMIQTNIFKMAQKSKFMVMFDFCNKLIKDALVSKEQIVNQSLSWQVSFYNIFIYLYFSPRMNQFETQYLRDEILQNTLTQNLKNKLLQSDVKSQSSKMMESVLSLLQREFYLLQSGQSSQQETHDLDFIKIQIQRISEQFSGSAYISYVTKIYQQWNNLEGKHTLKFLKFQQIFIEIASLYQKIDPSTRHLNVIIEFMKFVKIFKITHLSPLNVMINDLKSKFCDLKPSQLIEVCQLVSTLKINDTEINILISDYVYKYKEFITSRESLDILVSLNKIGYLEQKLYNHVFNELVQNQKIIFKTNRQDVFNSQGLWAILLNLLKFKLSPSSEEILIINQLFECYKNSILNQEQSLQQPIIARQYCDIYNLLELMETFNQEFAKQLNIISIEQKINQSESLNKIFQNKLQPKPFPNIINFLQKQSIKFEVNKCFGRKSVDIFLITNKIIICVENSMYLNNNQTTSGFSIMNDEILHLLLKRFPGQINKILKINENSWKNMDDKQKMKFLA